MAHIMEKSGHTNGCGIVTVETDDVRHTASKVVRPETVFETCVVCTGEHQIAQAQLTY